MEYIYTVLLLHKAGKPINEENVKRVLSAAGITPDEVRIKSLVAAVSEINIEEVLKSASATPIISAGPSSAAQAPAPEVKPAEKKEEKKEEREEEALAGLSALFG
ncbi:MAG: 50S ribosomal protein P1 [Candidatus Caldarchaeales archaeon]